MKLIDMLLLEAGMEDRLLNDENLGKRILLAMRHDPTFPTSYRVKLGPRVTPKEAMAFWIKLLNHRINDTDYGLIDNEKKYYDWITKLYAGHSVDWEDLSSRGKNHLMTYYILQRRGMLPPNEQNLNQFSNFAKFEKAMSKHAEQVRKYHEEERLKQLTKNAQIITLDDDNKYRILMPVNYGGSVECARGIGPFANWCTGVSSTDTHFKSYTSQGPLVIIIPKDNEQDKVRFHIKTNGGIGYFADIKDQPVNQKDFAEKYPDAMEKVVRGLESHKEEIEKLLHVDADVLVKKVVTDFRNAFGKTEEPESEEG